MHNSHAEQIWFSFSQIDSGLDSGFISTLEMIQLYLISLISSQCSFVMATLYHHKEDMDVRIGSTDSGR